MSTSQSPLDLVYSDVWGPALESVGQKILCLLLMILVSLPGYMFSKFKSEVF
jgi:hypothetical protein